ncbi:hypothetical protein [Allosalinactinospora lopnorensis]|uniref:hypothetical protein n=1 Tax=Allosalinactinospora lopnorensis TaxID=1352348 RepID=UPI000A8887CB|nr:hypothetical protein [Allosalinactinospora lopnorensis]
MTHEDGHAWEAPGSPPQPGDGQGPGASADPASPQTPWAAPGQHGSGRQHGWAAPGQATPASPPPGTGSYGGPAPGAPDPRSGVVALRPLNLNEILNGAFSYIRHNPKAVLGLAVIVIAVFSIVSSIGMGGYLADHGAWLGEAISDPTAAEADVPVAPWTVIVMYGGLLFSYIGQIVLTGLLAAVVGLAVLGRKLTMKEAMEAVRGRMGAVFGVAGLLFLIGLGWTGLLIGLILAASAVGLFAGVLPGLLVFLIGFAPLVALGVWVWVRTSLAMPVAVLERLGAGTSLVRSWQLTRRSWWRVFGA